MFVLIVELLFLKKGVRKKVMCMEEKVTISTCEKNDQKDQPASMIVLINSKENS